MSDEKKIVLSEKLQKIADQIDALSLIEASELGSYFEEKYGISSAPVAVGMVAPVASAPAEEKTEFTVMLTSAGESKLNVIKAVREILPNLGLVDAKKLVESAPKEIIENVKKDAAEEAKSKLEAAGAKVEIK